MGSEMCIRDRYFCNMIISSIKLLKNIPLSVGRNGVNYTRRNYQLTSAKANEADQDRGKLKPLKDVPGPKEYPIIGSRLEWRKNQKNKVHLWWMELQRTYGDVVKVNMGGQDIIYLFDPEYTQKMYGSDSLYPIQFGLLNFVWYRNVRRKEQYADGNAGVVGSTGSIWREQRTAVNPDMMRKSSAMYYVEDLHEISSDCVDRIAETRDENNEIRNALPDIGHSYALEQIYNIFLDVGIGALNPDGMSPKCKSFLSNSKKMNTSMTIMEKQGPFWRFFDTPAYKKFDEASTYMHNQISNDLKKAYKRILKEDVDKPRYEWSISHKIVDRFGENSTSPVIFVSELTQAGVETTSFTVTTLLYHLADNPIKQQIAFEEVDRIFGGGKLNAEGFGQLRYLRACMMESQRICPFGAGTSRILSNPIEVDGYLIPKGTTVLQASLVIGHDPRNYPEPERFLPERYCVVIQIQLTLTHFPSSPLDTVQEVVAEEGLQKCRFKLWL